MTTYYVTNEKIEYKYFTNKGSPWTSGNDVQLIKLYNENLLDIIKLAIIYKKSPGTIANRLKHLNIILYTHLARGYTEYKNSDLYIDACKNNRYNKKSKRIRFLTQLNDMYELSLHNQTITTEYFESLINIKKQLLKNEKIIKKYCPNYLEEFYEDAIYQRIADTLDLEKKEITAYKLKKKFREQFHDEKIEDTFIEDNKDSLKHFYSFFDDKSFKLDKNVYLKLKLLVSGNTTLRPEEIEEMLPQYSLLKNWIIKKYL
jgi:hypothetical protein